MKNKIELLAPSGSFESLMGAIQAGADSIYFGVEQLNMRAKSINNFTINDLPKISKICKEHSVKSYLTLNTVVFDHDMNLMKAIINAAKTFGIDSVIASDHAVINYAKTNGVPVHISTQTNITNVDTVGFYAAYADTMVMARELSLMQVSSIAKEIKRKNITGPSGNLVRIEIFGHGALCMAVSGKCYLSLHSNISSANRGACIQNCRKKYVVIDKEDGVELEVENEYIMSAKDLCTIDFIDKIIDAGVSVLKIEGRGRSPDYVYTVTKCYREAIDSFYDKTYNSKKITDWKNRLSTVFNRGFWDGYYLGRTMGEWSNVYGSAATRKKTYIAKGIKYYDKAGAATFLMESQTLSPGDEVLITGPTTGVIQTKIKELRVNDQKKEIVIKGETFSILLGNKIRPSDKLYKILLS